MGWGGEKEQETEKKPSEKWVKPNDTVPQKIKMRRMGDMVKQWEDHVNKV